jgi:beta-N-acetylhexosaminidase
MGGHIMMPTYMRQNFPGIKDEEMLPATLCKELMTGLLRDKLGFNGMVVTDASHMVGMTNRMTRKEMLPLSINAGCDMFLFFNDPQEDFDTMLEAYTTGIISEERMTEALTRILGLKAKMGLHKLAKEEIVPAPEALSIIGNEEHKKAAEAISADAITLVKYLDKDVLPLTPEKYKRIMIVDIKGAPGPMDFLIKAVLGAGGNKKTPAEDLRDRLIEKGFDAFIYESPLDRMKAQVARGEKPNINLYFAGKNAIEEFKSQQDLVISFCDIMNGRPSFGLSKGGGEIPWYVFELPVVGISVNTPTMLADMPMLRTYINAYDSKPSTMETLVNNLLEGPDAFKGEDPIDSFCGLFDAKI